MVVKRVSTVDLQDDEGWHALMFACACGHYQVAQMIVKACPNPQQVINLPKSDGVTSMMIALHSANTEVIPLLLQSGAYVNLKDMHGWSSLMLASQSGNTEMASLATTQK